MESFMEFIPNQFSGQRGSVLYSATHASRRAASGVQTVFGQELLDHRAASGGG